MTFSYLRAYANTKKNSLLASYFISAAINATLLACLILTPTSYLLNLQLIILVFEILVSFLLFIGSTYVDEYLQKNVAKKDFSSLIQYTQAYNFLAKYSWFDFIYSLSTFLLIAGSMVAIGWVWQTVMFIFFYGMSVIQLRTFISNLPQFVSTLDLQEEDFV